MKYTLRLRSSVIIPGFGSRYETAIDVYLNEFLVLYYFFYVLAYSACISGGFRWSTPAR